MKLKNMMILLLLLLVGLLSACAEEAIEAEASDQVTLVEDSKITPEFRSELNRFIDGVTEYSNEDKTYRDQYKESVSQNDKDTILTEYKTFLDDFDVYLQSYYLTPSNDVEGELTKHMRNYILHMKSRNSFQKQFTQTEDAMYDKLAMEEANETIIAIESLYNAMEKHEILNQ